MRLTNTQKVLLEVLKAEYIPGCLVLLEPKEYRAALVLRRKGFIKLDGLLAQWIDAKGYK